MAVRTRVRKSTTHGKGLFAAQRIRKGKFIGHYAGEKITDAEAERRHAGTDCILDGHTMQFNVKKDCIIDAKYKGGNATRFMNHSYTPNVVAYKEPDKERINFYARQNIQEGTEMFIDYGCTCKKCKSARRKAGWAFKSWKDGERRKPR